MVMDWGVAQLLGVNARAAGLTVASVVSPEVMTIDTSPEGWESSTTSTTAWVPDSATCTVSGSRVMPGNTFWNS